MKPFKNFFVLIFFMGLHLNLFALQKETKTLHKEIEVESDVLVEIENQFGDLKVTSWDQNKVVIDVEISVSGSNQNKVKEKLNDIEVYFDLNPNHVIARTKIEEHWTTKWFSNSKLRFQIDYTVKLPQTSNVDLKNDYGTLALNSLQGTANISCDYGKLRIGELLAENNRIAFDYSSNSTIAYIKGGSIEADYSSFELDEAEQLALKADYSKAEITRVDGLNFENEFGKLTLDNVNFLKGEGDYLTLRVGTVAQSVHLEHEFGSTRIEHLLPTVSSLYIETEYTGIQLGIDPAWSFDYSVELEFASFKTNIDLTHQKIEENSFEKKYSGYFGLANSGNTVYIDSEFGSVKFNSF